MNPLAMIESAFPLVTQIAQSGHMVQVLNDARQVVEVGAPLFSVRNDPAKLSAAIAAMQRDGRLAKVEAAAMDMLQALGPLLANPDNVARLLKVAQAAKAGA